MVPHSTDSFNMREGSLNDVTMPSWSPSYDFSAILTPDETQQLKDANEAFQAFAAPYLTQLDKEVSDIKKMVEESLYDMMYHATVRDGGGGEV